MGYCIQLAEGFTFGGDGKTAEIKPVWAVRVFEQPEGYDKTWPTKRAKAMLALVGDTEEDAVKALLIWIRAGHRTDVTVPSD